MPTYRFYLLTANDRIHRGFDADCPDDAAAASHARSLAHPHAVEIWEGRRSVARVESGVGDRRA